AQDISKVPLLGDIPFLGALFRSKQTNRQKTEVILFIEARVLDANPDINRGQSSENFTLGQPYVSGDLLDNPLEYGMYRAGFGAYLPPVCAEEGVFWERLGRRIRKVSTEVHDIA